MKFLSHLNESVEDKFFSLLDDFLKWKEISGEELKNYIRFKEFASSIGDMFDIIVHPIYVSDVNNLSGKDNRENRRIVLTIGRGPFKTSMVLTCLLHELIHHFQYEYETNKGTDPKTSIMSDRFPNLEKDFTKYFFSKIENQAWVITVAGAMITYNIDPNVMFDDIKQFFNYKDSEEFRDEYIRLKRKYNQGMIYRFVDVYTTQIYKSLFAPPLEDTKNKLFKLKKFEKQVRRSYRKLKGYFQRYNIS